MHSLFFCIYLSYSFSRPHLGSTSSSCFCNCAQNVLHSTYRRQLEFKQQNHATRASASSGTKYFDVIFEDKKDEDISKATLIWRAVKLPIYSVALVPLTVSF